ncbi:hypothetical protein BGZ76_006599, partial [Entomortierella beljakovae]
SLQALVQLDEIHTLDQYIPNALAAAKGFVHILVELPQQGAQKRKGDDQVNRGSEKRLCVIPVAGPVSEDDMFILPFNEREIFNKVVDGMHGRRSFIVHGPYQSGKSSFLKAVQARLVKLSDKPIIVNFDMIPKVKSLKSQGLDYTAALDKLSEFLSFLIFQDEMKWDKLENKLNQLPPFYPRIYIFIDEFQSIFDSDVIADASKDFFRTISNSTNISYLGVGTFKLMELLNDEGQVNNSPFNKAIFYQMPFFTNNEMCTLFTKYKTIINPSGVIDSLQTEIMTESSGHPASFMMLLNIADTYTPNLLNWSEVYDANIGSLLNGTHHKVMDALKKLTSEEKGEVRAFIAKGMESWSQTFDNLIRHLLGIGILVPHGGADIRFTSGIIYRVCIEALYPKPALRLSSAEISDPITLLQLGLQCITPSTINHSLVKIKHGLEEKSFQAALYVAISGLLPTNMKCLFEVKAKDQDHLDLMVIEDGSNWAAYEFKVGAITRADFKPHLAQAERYRKHFEREIYLVNFYLEGQQTPETPSNIPKQVTVINIKHNSDCTRFNICAPDLDEMSVNLISS